MTLTGLHLLLTYSCLFECEHCFVWGGAGQRGTMTLVQVRTILEQADELGSVDTVFFEGGEPFLYYALVLAGARLAKERGYRVGIVSNAYWATGADDARAWLAPFAGVLDVLHLSDDRYHGDEAGSERVRHAREAAEESGAEVGVISVAMPEDEDPSSLAYRGRAAARLASRATGRPWREFTECPHEDLREPGRVHVDPLGNVHLCQGLVLGNLFETPLAEMCAAHDPDAHAVLSPLLDGGPAELVRRHGLPHDERPADACHLCYEARRRLRAHYPESLGPDQMYGE